MEHFENSYNKRILILEQEGIIAMDIQRDLENNGYRAYRALSLVKNSIKHLVIVDTLYKKNELEELKKQCKKNGLPIIYITSEIDNKVIN